MNLAKVFLKVYDEMSAEQVPVVLIIQVKIMYFIFLQIYQLKLWEIRMMVKTTIESVSASYVKLPCLVDWDLGSSLRYCCNTNIIFSCQYSKTGTLYW